MSDRKGMRYIAGFAGLAATALLLSCAQVAGPSGGPPDKTPPRLIGSTPANGAVQIPSSDNKITIQFSENVQAVGSGRQVYISPRPTREPKLSWHGDRLEVSLGDTLRSNQTYILQVSAAVSDLRNNQLDSAIIIAFSTGAGLDSGKIGGTVVTGAGMPQSGALVGLYPVQGPMDSLRYDSIYPDYLSLTNAKGKFEFRNLPDRAFQLIAWLDRNRDEKFNPRVESYAVPDRPITGTTGDACTDLSMVMGTIDTAKAEILSASYLSDKLLKIRMNKAVRFDQLARALDGISVAPLADSAKIIHPTGFLERDDTAGTVMTLAIQSLTDSAYSVAVRYDSLREPAKLARFVPKGGEDKEEPTIAAFSPAGSKPVYAQDVRLRVLFSEPLDTNRIRPGAFKLTRVPSKENIPLQAQWRDPFHLDFVTPSLQAASQFEFRIADSSIYDLAGNKMADSVVTRKFNTVNPDSLGTIAGTFKIEYQARAKDLLILRFREVTGKADLQRPCARGVFEATLPAGKYILSGFLDSNRNGKRDVGSVWPYQLGETGAVSTDTVTVRARFETDGVLFRIK